jgi:hypothetical protein
MNNTIMALEVTGKLFKVLSPISGNGKAGTWTRRDFIVETTEQYPKKICFSAWGDKVDEIGQVSIGESIKVSFDPQSREFNEKWYTDLRAWRIERLEQSAGNGQTPPPPSSEWLDNLPESNSSVDDLPF